MVRIQEVSRTSRYWRRIISQTATYFYRPGRLYLVNRYRRVQKVSRINENQVAFNVHHNTYHAYALRLYIPITNHILYNLFCEIWPSLPNKLGLEFCVDKKNLQLFCDKVIASIESFTPLNSPAASVQISLFLNGFLCNRALLIDSGRAQKYRMYSFHRSSDMVLSVLDQLSAEVSSLCGRHTSHDASDSDPFNYVLVNANIISDFNGKLYAKKLVVSTQRYLGTAISSGKKSRVKLYLEDGVSPNMKLESGLEPLSVAAQNGSIEIVQLLLNYGALVDGICADSLPLVMAYSNNHLGIVELLLRRGAKQNLEACSTFSYKFHSIDHMVEESVLLESKIRRRYGIYHRLHALFHHGYRKLMRLASDPYASPRFKKLGSQLGNEAYVWRTGLILFRNMTYDGKVAFEQEWEVLSYMLVVKSMLLYMVEVGEASRYHDTFYADIDYWRKTPFGDEPSYFGDIKNKVLQTLVPAIQSVSRSHHDLCEATKPFYESRNIVLALIGRISPPGAKEVASIPKNKLQEIIANSFGDKLPEQDNTIDANLINVSSFIGDEALERIDLVNHASGTIEDTADSTLGFPPSATQNQTSGAISRQKGSTPEAETFVLCSAEGNHVSAVALPTATSATILESDSFPVMYVYIPLIFLLNADHAPEQRRHIDGSSHVSSAI